MQLISAHDLMARIVSCHFWEFLLDFKALMWQSLSSSDPLRHKSTD